MTWKPFVLTQIAVKLELIHTFAPAKDGLMPPITEFLEARIAEDEAEAKWVDDYGDSGSSPLFHPSRILAECAAKRAIMSRHVSCDDVSYGDASTCPEMRVLAAVYSDHPDYQQEWARG